MVSIPDIENNFERYIAFLVERDRIYTRKKHGEPWPWTDDPILQTYRFTEIYRERDRTSLHYQKTIRNRYMDENLVLPGTVLYRWFNRIETCDALFNAPDLGNKSIFEHYIHDGRPFETLAKFIHNQPSPHVTGAYIINGMPGHAKGIGVMIYFHEWCVQKDWEKEWEEWLRHPPLLCEMYTWLQKEAQGLGSFMTAQLVADLKYLFFARDIEDWWTWAAPGPGSMRGLNVVLDRPMFQGWDRKEWLSEIQKLRIAENETLGQFGLGPFHAQDTQNHCCEFSKYTKEMRGLGRPRQKYAR